MHERMEKQSEMAKASQQKYSSVRRGGAGMEKISSRNQYFHSDVVSMLNLCVGTQIFGHFQISTYLALRAVHRSQNITKVVIDIFSNIFKI